MALTTGTPHLKLAEVTKSYRSNEGAGLAILKGISLEMFAGESLAIVGPSGSGKSTLLNIIGTLDQPDSGSVQIGATEVTRLDETALAAVRNREIGFIFQGHHLLPQCSVLENVLVPTLAADAATKKGAIERAKIMLERVGLGHRHDHRPGQLSGGEKQRAAVVRALINQPRLLLADEPTGALDRSSAANLINLLQELNQEHQLTLIVVTHAIDIARKMERTCELQEGKLVEV
ncbi:MAG: ABC transporter ATP-binding protein [Verrucomicrobiales bacterium]